MAVQFGVSYSGGEYEYFRVRRWPILIGRSPKADLCLSQSALISRTHARVTKTDAGYQIVALGRNPSYLNGERLLPGNPRAFGCGDLLELPDYRLELRVTAERPSATVRMEAVPDSSAVVRRIAAAADVGRWTVEGIQAWLQVGSSREIWVRHGNLTLCLNRRLDVEEIARRIELFETLISADAQGLAIEVIEPYHLLAAG